MCVSVCARSLQGAARIFLLTKKSVVLADQKTGQVKASVPLPDLASVSVSTQTDGFFALKLKEVRFTKTSILTQHLSKNPFKRAIFGSAFERLTAGSQQQFCLKGKRGNILKESRKPDLLIYFEGRL